MARFGLGLAFAAVLLAAAVPAIAQPAEGPVVRKEGEYAGVKPGEGPDSADKGKPKRAPAKNTLLWVGFTPKEGGGSELFFQAATPFTVSQRLEGKTLVVVLAGLKGMARNVKRPLDTRFFDAAVARVTVRKVGARRARRGVPGHAAGIEVRVAFKDPRDAREGAARTETGTDKMFYAYLGFGPPSTPTAPATAPTEGPSMEDPEADNARDD